MHVTPRLPDWLVLGAAKSGTTSIAYWLHGHPQVHLAPVKEVRFFDREENFSKGTDWYREQFAGATADQTPGEATPEYLWHPDAPGRIAALLPNAKLIALLRHPVDRAYSHYWHARAWGAQLPDFATVVRAALDGNAGWRHFLERGHYAEQIARYDRLYPTDALLLLLFEDLESQPEATFGEVCRHLGVEVVTVPGLGTAYNRAYRRRSMRLRRVMERVDIWERIPRRWANALDQWNTVPTDYPPMDPPVRTLLLEHYAQSTADLEHRLGRALPQWYT